MNYSRLARTYQWIEGCTMGSALQRARVGQLARLASVISPRRVLIVGEGDGSFLLSFVRQFPEADVYVVESSAAMVTRAQARLRDVGLLSDRIVFINEPLLEASLSAEPFDLIVTLFFFDNFENAEVMGCIEKLKASMAAGAYWLLSDFCLPVHGWRRIRARIWLKVLYGFFRLTTDLPARALPDTEALLEAAGLRLVDRKPSCGGMLYASLLRCE